MRCYVTRMAIWTREELIRLIDAWKAAYLAASTGKSYTIGSRTLTRYDLDEIRKQLAYLDNELAGLGAPRGIRRVQLRVGRP